MIMEKKWHYIYCKKHGVVGNSGGYCDMCYPNEVNAVEEYQERHYKTHQRAQNSAFNTQVGGNHYTKLAIQPMEYSFKNKLDPCQHTAIKYITRFRDKGGRQDLEKAIDCIQMLIEMEYGK